MVIPAGSELAGDWRVVSAILDGYPLEDKMVAAGHRVVEGSDVTVLFGSQVYAKAKFTVDVSKTPMNIDYYNTQGANAGKKQQGIYELKRDSLRLCLAAPGRERPTDFSSQLGDQRTFMVWSR